MAAKNSLNGCDYLMLGFDHELRRRGFAGNSCQIILELAAPISPDALCRRLDTLLAAYPILRARPGGLLWPKWNAPRKSDPVPEIRTHRHDAELRQRLFNEPITSNHGEQMRFDLVERDGGKMDVIFTWSHALMDARSAEYFVALVGREDLPMPDANAKPPARPRLPLRERMKLAWKNIHQLDEFCKAAPRSLGARRPEAPGVVRHRVEKFDAAETERIRAHATKFCGPFGAAQFHSAVGVVELHQLHQRLAFPSASYVLPIPVALRPKGRVDPLFSNQIIMLMIQFLPAHLASVADAVAEQRRQTEQGMRSGLLDSGVMLAELFRFLPLPLYIAMVKQGLRGEICSLFYGDTSAVNPAVTTFLGVPIEDFVHIASITPSPGVGMVFYYFRGLLRVTVEHSSQALTDEEAAEFSARLRARLLDP
ncbi:MAG: hypothetical protein HY301_12970 [Verrucomicrobia bacterium]|nr:hypothetical protein [Verrucomicrobiota bacterium]